MSALEALLRPRQHIAAFDGDLRAELFHGRQMHIHGPGADGAATGKGHLQPTTIRRALRLQERNAQLTAIRLMPARGSFGRILAPLPGRLRLLWRIGSQETAEGEPFASAELEKAADVLGRKGVQGPIHAVF